MPAKGQIEVEILPDGRLRIETGDMGGVHHRTADDFLAFVALMMGGAVETTKAKHGHTHAHASGDTHSHA